MHAPRTLLVASLAVLAAAAVHAQSGVFVLTSDFATGSAAYLAPGAATAQVNLLALHGDAVGRFQAGRLYVINRLGQDNILVLDPAAPRTPVVQFSVGNGSNPHDIEILAAGKAYVTRYDVTELLIVDPRDGTALGTIDLSAFADGDGRPEMSQIVRLGGYAYVTCQRLDRDAGFVPLDARLAVIDLATDAVVGSIPLSATNPNSVVAVGDARLVVAGSAGFGDRAGGIEVVDVDGAGGGASLGLVVGETALGGDLSLLALRSATAGFAVVLDESFANTVVPVDLATGRVGAPLEGLSGGYVPSLAVDGDRLLVADQGSFSDPAGAGLKVFDADTGALLAGPIATGLPPVDIVVLAESPITAVVARTGAAVPGQAALQPGFPNPFNATVRLAFDVAVDGAVELTVHDALGRRVASVVSSPLAAGRYAATWDGTDDGGRAVGNGVYVVRLRSAGQAAATKVTLLK